MSVLGRVSALHPALAAAVVLILMAPGNAWACAVCTAGRDEENQTAFLLSTIFMSAIPLIVIGTLVFVLYRRIQKLESERAPDATRGAAGPRAATVVSAAAADVRPR